MHDPPSISVVLPSRNRPAMLREALAGVLGQTAPPSEVLIIEDGAGDAHGAVAEAARAHMCARVLEGPHRGPGAARNLGLAAAAGDLVAFLDDDDVWLPEKLARQRAWFTARPGLGLLGTLCAPLGRPRAGRAKGYRARAPSRVSLPSLIRANRFVTSTVLARRELLDECGGFDESLTLAQDWDLWLRVAMHCEAAILPERLAVYRRHQGQRSGDQTAMRRCETEVLRRVNLRLRGGRRRLREVARRRLAWAHCRLGRALARAGEPGRAMQEFRRSAELFPSHPLPRLALARCALTGGAPEEASP